MSIKIFLRLGRYVGKTFLNGKGLVSYPVNMTIGDHTLWFPENQVMASSDVQISVSSGDLNG